MGVSKKKILIRADGGEGIGLGKLVISLTVARKLQEKGADVLFVTVKHHLWAPSIFRGVKTKILPQSFFQEGMELTDKEIQKFKPDAVILNITDPDIYETQKLLSKFPEWIIDLRKRGVKVIGLEGHATKGYRPDLLVNGTIVKEWHKYENFTDTKYCVGPEYLILRESFSKKGASKKIINKECKTIFVGVGGGTEGVERVLFPRILSVLSVLGFKGNILFTVGAAYQNIESLKPLLARWKNAKLLYGITEKKVVDSMAEADLAITAGGITLYELASLGVPSLVVSIVPHQLLTAKAFEKKGAAKSLGMNPDVSILEKQLSRIMKDVSIRKDMSKNAQKLVDGKGLYRTLQQIEKLV